MKVEVIQELAMSQDDIESKLTELSTELVNHLVMIFVWRNEPEVPHWISELKAFPSEVKKMKHNKKFPNKEFVAKYLWDNADIKFVIKDLIYDQSHGGKYEKMPKLKLSWSKEATKFAQEYIIWLADKLSKQGKVSLADRSNKIYELLSKYPLI